MGYSVRVSVNCTNEHDTKQFETNDSGVPNATGSVYANDAREGKAHDSV